MKNKILCNQLNDGVIHHENLILLENTVSPKITQKENKHNPLAGKTHHRSEILVVTSYPPRECGIATYSQDLIKALNNKFSNSLSIKVCALETGNTMYPYDNDVRYILNTSSVASFEKMAAQINHKNSIKVVLIQHEFGFYREQKQAFMQFLYELTKPIAIVFHTVLPNPNEKLRLEVRSIAAVCESIIVMTHTSANILKNDYGVDEQKIAVIAHGTHLVPHSSEQSLKEKYGLQGRKVLSTFGLLSSGKSIETTLEALPAIVKQCPEVVFLILGKTHPEVVKNDGEAYREMLEQKVEQLYIQDNVVFINKYLSLPELLDYLQLTDIYLFTTNDPNQAVSGTFAYAMSCACPIISTPIPHAKEVLTEDTGIIFDFRNSKQLADSVIRLLNDDHLRKNISLNTLQKIVFTAWENSAVEHAMLLERILNDQLPLSYNLPKIKLDHMRNMTTDIGIIQFSKINQPDINTGYTLDDNARALIASCMYLKQSGDNTIVTDIHTYLNFIKRCLQPSGNFLNYVDKNLKFTGQNEETNLDDANGRAIWALGYVVSLTGFLPETIILEAKTIIEKTLPNIVEVHSTRAMAFAIKGIYYYQGSFGSKENINLITIFADRLVQMYKHESSDKWKWFEGYLTYANSILPEALLYAWLLTGKAIYKEIAISSFDFLLSQTFNENGIEVISNKNWLKKGQVAGHFGEQPIDVAYTILALDKFFEVFQNVEYRQKMEVAFNWFLGNNRLHQIIYNPCTGGCYDGMEENNVNLNQGAESTVSYLMARFTVGKYNNIHKSKHSQLVVSVAKKSKKEDALHQFTLNRSIFADGYSFITNSLGLTNIRSKSIVNV